MPGWRLKGQGLIEYGLIIMLVSVFCVGAMTALGVGIGDIFSFAVF